MINFDKAVVLEQYATHLRFLGFDAQVENNELVVARHPVKSDILVLPFPEGTILRAFFRAGDEAKRDRIGYLNIINQANAQAVVARYYADGESDFVYEAFYSADYSQTGFSRFLELWDKDFQTLIAINGLTSYLV